MDDDTILTLKPAESKGKRECSFSSIQQQLTVESPTCVTGFEQYPTDGIESY